MINPFQEINWRPDRTDLQKFGVSLIIGGTVLLLGATIVRMACVSVDRTAFVFQMIFSVIIICGFIAKIFPACSKPAYYIWFFFGACVGIVISNLILILFYYLFFTPIALIVRLSGRDPLYLQQSGTKTCWQAKAGKTDPKRYYRQY